MPRACEKSNSRGKKASKRRKRVGKKEPGCATSWHEKGVKTQKSPKSKSFEMRKISFLGILASAQDVARPFSSARLARPAAFGFGTDKRRSHLVRSHAFHEVQICSSEYREADAHRSSLSPCGFGGVGAREQSFGRRRRPRRRRARSLRENSSSVFTGTVFSEDSSFSLYHSLNRDSGALPVTFSSRCDARPRSQNRFRRNHASRSIAPPPERTSKRLREASRDTARRRPRTSCVARRSSKEPARPSRVAFEPFRAA